MTNLEQAVATISAETATDCGYVEVRRNTYEVILGGDRQGLLGSRRIAFTLHSTDSPVRTST